MKNLAVAVLIGFIRNLLESAAQNLWEGLWEEIFKAVVEAEIKWKDEGMGDKKKEFVKDWIIDFLENHPSLDLGWIQQRLVNIFINQVIDAIVDSLNEELGHDWLKRAEEVERNLSGRLFFIK